MKFTPSTSGRRLDGKFYRFDFDNGYGASVISHYFSYGGTEGKWELAVIGPDGRLNYETPITCDVIGHLEWDEVEGLLDRIASLPEAKESEAQ